jgi:formylglycine-generating enzyme required for sulfatase activity
VFWKQYQRDLKERGVILLDGLDEVAEDCENNRRAVLRRAIEDFTDNSVAETAWVIVTSRPYAYESEEQKLHGFQLLDMEPMQTGQVREFIRHWYLAARQANSWDEATATRRAVQLADEIEARSPYLPQLAETPLLLTLIIGLDYADIRLPVSRARLYEEAVELMLQRWNQRLQDFRKELSEAEREGLEVLERSRDELLEAMQALAFRSYQEIGACSDQLGAEKPLEFSKDMLLARLWDTFKQGQNHDNLIYFLEYRSGILIGGSRPEHFQFAHKSFHEYLAARCLLQKVQWKKEIEELLCRDMDWWREVFLLLLKKYSDVQYGESIQFIDHLLRDIPPQDIQPKEQKLILLFSVACVELNLAGRQEQDSLYRKVLGKLRAWLEEIMRGDALDIQQRAEAGRLLGELGDPRPGVTVDDNGRPDIDWVEIPSVKSFMMGSDDEDAYDNEKPVHPVDVDSFSISRFPITNAQYRCFIEADGYKKSQYWQTEAARQWQEGGGADEKLIATYAEKYQNGVRDWLKKDTERRAPRFWHDRKWNNSNHPVVGVSWFEALAFCAWLSEVTGKTVRLPNEEEWEYAARGIQGLQYAWGDDFSENLGNTEKTGLERTSAVGLFPRGEAFGLHDMTGNVWEWTVNRWGKDLGSPQFTYVDWDKQNRDER